MNDRAVRRLNHPNQAGFTLLEVLVASALFLILMVLLMTVISNTTTIASKTSEQIEATRIARESLDLIGRDIVSATIPWNRTNTNSLQFVVNPAALTAAYANRDAMFWQAPLVRDATNGNLAIVGYFVSRDFVAGSRDSRLQLRRTYIEPGNTNTYKIYSTPNAWLDAATFSDFGPTGAGSAEIDNQNAQRGWVADGILGMWVRCLDRTGSAIVNTTNSGIAGFDSRLGYRISGKQWYPTNYSALPAFVEVTLVCMAPRELGKLKALPTTPTTTTNANFPATISTYVDQVRAGNPGVKSIASFSRKFRLQNSD